MPFWGFRLSEDFKKSIGSQRGGADQRWTNLISPCSIHLITMLSLSHTPVVHIDKGPQGCEAPITSSPIGFLSVSFSESRDRAIPSGPLYGRFCRHIGLARTTWVKIRSPTMISSWSRIEGWREEKYERIAVIHEYAGLNDLWNRTGARTW